MTNKKLKDALMHVVTTDAEVHDGKKKALKKRPNLKESLRSSLVGS